MKYWSLIAALAIISTVPSISNSQAAEVRVGGNVQQITTVGSNVTIAAGAGTVAITRIGSMLRVQTGGSVRQSVHVGSNITIASWLWPYAETNIGIRGSGY